MPESLTSGFLWSRWRGKRYRHSRLLCNQQFYVFGKRPILTETRSDKMLWSDFLSPTELAQHISQIQTQIPSRPSWCSVVRVPQLVCYKWKSGKLHKSCWKRLTWTLCDCDQVSRFWLKDMVSSIKGKFNEVSQSLCGKIVFYSLFNLY